MVAAGRATCARWARAPAAGRRAVAQLVRPDRRGPAARHPGRDRDGLRAPAGEPPRVPPGADRCSSRPRSSAVGRAPPGRHRRARRASTRASRRSSTSRDFEPDRGAARRSSASTLGRAATLVVARPAPDARRLPLVRATRCSSSALQGGAARPARHVVVLPRHPEQRRALEALDLPRCVIPRAAIDTRSLMSQADLMIGAGGTMTREAALMGVPTLSLFAGRRPAVDRWLEERGFMRVLGPSSDLSAGGPATRGATGSPDLRERGSAPGRATSATPVTPADEASAHGRRHAAADHLARPQRGGAPRPRRLQPRAPDATAGRSGSWSTTAPTTGRRSCWRELAAASRSCAVLSTPRGLHRPTAATATRSPPLRGPSTGRSRTVDWRAFTHIGKLDGDIELPDDYFERLLAEFDRDPALGIGGGVARRGGRRRVAPDARGARTTCAAP